MVAKQTTHLSPLCNYESIKILSVGGEQTNIDLSPLSLSLSLHQLTGSRDINREPRILTIS